MGNSEKRWKPDIDDGVLQNDLDYLLCSGGKSDAMQAIGAIMIWVEDYSRFSHDHRAWETLNELVFKWGKADPDEFAEAFRIPMEEMAQIRQTFSKDESDYERFIEIHLVFRGLANAARSVIDRSMDRKYGLRRAETAFTAFLKSGTQDNEAALVALHKFNGDVEICCLPGQAMKLLLGLVRFAEAQAPKGWPAVTAMTDSPDVQMRRFIGLLRDLLSKQEDKLEIGDSFVLESLKRTRQSEAFHRWIS